MLSSPQTLESVHEGKGERVKTPEETQDAALPPACQWGLDYRVGFVEGRKKHGREGESRDREREKEGDTVMLLILIIKLYDAAIEWPGSLEHDTQGLNDSRR